MACPARPCPHCDRPCTARFCPPCRAIERGMANADAVMRTRPKPDTTSDGPVTGAVDRCPNCGGRAFHTTSGLFCPRAGCP